MGYPRQPMAFPDHTTHGPPAPQMRELGETREDAMRALAARDVAPGVVGYADGEPVAWCSISPRTEIPRLGAPAVAAYPIDNRAADAGAAPDRIDLTMAFAGTWSMFDKAGFAVVGETRAEGSGRPRLVMRRDC